MIRATLLMLCLLAASKYGNAAPPDSALAAIRAFFDAPADPGGQTHADAVAEALDGRWDQLSSWLHAAGLFRPIAPGRQELRVSVFGNLERPVVLQIPEGYEPGRPWPVIYALHGSGSNADGAISMVNRLIGRRAVEYVIAAPESYGEWLLGDHWPPANEHAAVLQALRKHIHCDANRLYCVGYSRGGHAAWTLAIQIPDQFAAIMPLAGALLLPEGQMLWPDLLPNMENTPVFACWGKNDTLGAKGEKSREGGIAQLNRDLGALAAKLELPGQFVELPEAGHGDVLPPDSLVDAWLAARRAVDPPRVRQRFRDTIHSATYWLEGRAWVGEQWGNQPMTLSFRDGENPMDSDDTRAATRRELLSRLGELQATRDGNSIRARRKLQKELVVWFGPTSIDWTKPVELRFSDRPAFNDRLNPSAHLALAAAARTWDFDRLRLAGIYFRSGGKARPATVDDLGSMKP